MIKYFLAIVVVIMTIMVMYIKFLQNDIKEAEIINKNLLVQNKVLESDNDVDVFEVNNSVKFKMLKEIRIESSNDDIDGEYTIDF